MGDKGVGLTGKYRVYKYSPCPDGNCTMEEHLNQVTDPVFVLKPNTDPIAKVALYAYAEEAAAQGWEPLAEDLFNWLGSLDG